MAASPYLDALPLAVPKHTRVIPEGNDVRDALAYVALRLASGEVGLTISRAAVPVNATVVLYVSPWLLDKLGYDDQAQYEAAVAQPDFVHAEDLPVVADHLRHRNSAPYNARLKRSDASYQELRLQGFSIFAGTVAGFVDSVAEIAEHRFSLYWQV